jgi:hypothetical protein
MGIGMHSARSCGGGRYPFGLGSPLPREPRVIADDRDHALPVVVVLPLHHEFLQRAQKTMLDIAKKAAWKVVELFFGARAVKP